ncbi:MAG: glutaredoxin family protein [Nitrospirae bacterium]|nr:glutaredoxin family protein [Nitrospirota bacterium]
MQHVKLYTLSTCGHCKAAKKFLDSCMVAYEFTDVDLLSNEEKNAAVEEIKKLTSQCAFPTIIIGDKVIVGNNEQKIKEALGI